MILKSRKHSQIHLLLILLGIFSVACEQYFPETYQDEDFAMEAVDERACGLVRQDTAFKAVTIRYDSLCAVMDSLTSDSVDASVGEFNTVFDSLQLQLDTLYKDMALRIKYPVHADQGYAYYYPAEISTVGGGVVFFSDAYIDVDVIDRDGNLIGETSNAIPLESISGCYEVWIDPITKKLRTATKIQTRYVFSLEEAPYLVRFTLLEPLTDEFYQVAILPVE